MSIVIKRVVEEVLIALGILGLLLIFQPFSILGYSVGWIILLNSTLVYVVFTLIPRSPTPGKLVKSLVKTLVIVVVIVVLFIALSIFLTPYIV